MPLQKKRYGYGDHPGSVTVVCGTVGLCVCVPSGLGLLLSGCVAAREGAPTGLLAAVHQLAEGLLLGGLVVVGLQQLLRLMALDGCCAGVGTTKGGCLGRNEPLDSCYDESFVGCNL